MQTSTTMDDIRAARAVIHGRVHRTPLLTSRILGERAGVRLFLKAENLQKTGSFKPRGVLNKLRHLSDDEKRRGLITISAGNHAQALAYGASLEGLRATVVMPGHASATKVAACRAYGAEVVLGGTMHEAFEKVHELRDARNLTLVHPYDDPYIIAGQGTVGLEILEDLPDVDAVVVAIGGGGLISGVASAVKLSRPGARVIGVEPEGAPTLWTALRRNAITRLDSVNTIADGLTAPVAGVLTFAAVRQFVDEVVLVSDAEIGAATTAVLQYAKLLVEPAGAAGLAALLSGRVRFAAGARVAVVLSGGNVDWTVLQSLF
ncbi:MAG TPA: threonine/serine dehydratase [bacterium]|nr:threonine/serine dehydratase [bacterium]